MPDFSNAVYRLIFVIVTVLQIALFFVELILQAYMRRHITCRNYERAANLELAVLLFYVLSLRSWMHNWGFFRHALTLVAFPLLHAVVFVFVNLFAGFRLGRSKLMRILTALSCITFVAAYLLFPDGVGAGGLFVFFRTIRNHTIAFMCGIISLVLFAVNIIVCVLQLIAIARIPISAEEEGDCIDVTDIVRQIDEDKITSA